MRGNGSRISREGRRKEERELFCTHVHEVVDVWKIFLQKVFENESVNLKGVLHGRNKTRHIMSHSHTVKHV